MLSRPLNFSSASGCVHAASRRPLYLLLSGIPMQLPRMCATTLPHDKQQRISVSFQRSPPYRWIVQREPLSRHCVCELDRELFLCGVQGQRCRRVRALEEKLLSVSDGSLPACPSLDATSGSSGVSVGVAETPVPHQRLQPPLEITRITAFSTMAGVDASDVKTAVFMLISAGVTGSTGAA